MARKALAILFLFVSLLVTSAKVSYAQETAAPWGPQYDANQLESYRAAVEGDNCMTPSLECLVHQTSRFVAIEWVNSILYPNGAPATNNNAPGEYDQINDLGPLNNTPTILSGTGKLIGYLYTYPVANTGTYIADVMNSAHITPKAYAQGVGFSALNPILELWKAFRNIAYMFFVLLFIVIGFMIMFRKKVSGQAAITAQQAIPSVIISLILVTFSYAIAGLMIDLMYLSMFLIIGIFGQTLPDGSENLINMDIFQVMGALFTAAGVSGSGFTGNIDLVSNFLANLINIPALEQTVGIIGGITLTLVLAIAILIGTIKLFFELLKSYASIVLSVVTAPITLMMGAIPGSNPVVPWIKDLFGHLLAFPVVLLVLVLFYQFTSLTGGSGTEGGFIPPFMIGRGQSGAIASLMGLALILALPEIVKDVKKKFVKEGFGTMVFNAAAKNAKAAWTGSETKGWGAKRVTKIGAGVAGAGALATAASVGGAIYGGKKGIAGRTGFRGAAAGAAIGAGAGLAAIPVIKYGPKVARKASSIGKNIQGIGYTAASMGPFGQYFMDELSRRRNRNNDTATGETAANGEKPTGEAGGRNSGGI